MCITLSAPPAVVQDVRTYAERHATSLNALIREHLEKIAALEREERKEGARRLKNFFESETAKLLARLVPVVEFVTIIPNEP